MIIEWERVAELHAEIGADGFGEVVELFLEEADEVIARIACQSGASALEADLHFLKGAALNLGFADFAALCAEGERRANAGDTDIDLAAVRQCYAQSRQELMQGLDRVAA